MRDLRNTNAYELLDKEDTLDDAGKGRKAHEDTAPRPPGYVKVLLAVASSVSWMIVSTLLILLNKHIMVDIGFKYPMTVSSMGMAASGCFSYICCRMKWVEAKQTVTTRFYLTRISPIVLLMAITLFTGNQVYLYLSVSFIQMLKAFTPVITMIALFIARLEDPSVGMILAVVIVAGGTALAAYGEVQLSYIGLVCMFSSEVAESVRLVLTQFLLVGLKFHPIEGLMYLAPACCLWLVLGSTIFELPLIAARGHWALAAEHKMLFLLAACLGFAVNLLAYCTIKLASALTLKVLGTVKNALLVVVMVALFGEVVTVTQAWGYFMSLIGFGWYNQLKLKQIASDKS
jgi:drug/metabolite transporter (DMT)-like permease